MADAARYAPRIVVPYAPKVVILYPGENDIARGVTAEAEEREADRDEQPLARRVLAAPPTAGCGCSLHWA